MVRLLGRFGFPVAKHANMLVGDAIKGAIGHDWIGLVAIHARGLRPASRLRVSVSQRVGVSSHKAFLVWLRLLFVELASRSFSKGRFSRQISAGLALW
jgi:hypothetical protein